ENAQKEGKPIPSTVVTLLVSPDDAERIALAQSEGSLMLALRNPLDVDPTETRGARTANLFNGVGGAPAPPPAKPKPAVRRLEPQPVVPAVAVAPVPEPPKVCTVE